MNKGVSVIICCYNSELLLEKTLQHIAAQNFDADLACELILVDNSSTDNTAGIARSIWSKIGSNKIGFEIIQETLPGLSHARKKGISKAKYEYLIFCDDDNWLDETYVQNVFSLFSSNPDVAILGGIGTAEFEDSKSVPPWFNKFYHSYAVGAQADKECLVNGVYGAGMALRKSALANVVYNSPLFLDDRKKNTLSAGGDSELCYRIRLAGYKILYSPRLTFKHFLTTRRLTWAYVKQLHVGFSKGHVILNLYQSALNVDTPELSRFEWLKKAFYYWIIYFKYWPKHYSIYKNGEGSVEEIHHLIWKVIALSYMKYNISTVGIYQNIIRLKAKQVII